MSAVNIIVILAKLIIAWLSILQYLISNVELSRVIIYTPILQLICNFKHNMPTKIYVQKNDFELFLI